MNGQNTWFSAHLSFNKRFINCLSLSKCLQVEQRFQKTHVSPRQFINLGNYKTFDWWFVWWVVKFEKTDLLTLLRTFIRARSLALAVFRPSNDFLEPTNRLLTINLESVLEYVDDCGDDDDCDGDITDKNGSSDIKEISTS